MKIRFSVDYFVYVGSFVPLLFVLVFGDFPDGTFSEKLLLSVIGLLPVLVGGYWSYDLVSALSGKGVASVLNKLGLKERLVIALSASFVAQAAIYIASKASTEAVIYTVVLSPVLWVVFLFIRARTKEKSNAD